MASIRGLLTLSRSILFNRHHFSPVTRPRSPFHFIQQPIRFFASDADMLKQFKTSQISRVSIREPQANRLISAIREGNYTEARQLVKSGVNVDGHHKGENTALTDAAKRGDAKGVEFLLKNLKVNPYASCDCPHHKTAMHYAAENGETNVVKVLLANGVKPNILDRRKYTALDIAKTREVKQLLIANGGQTAKELEKNPVLVNRYLPKK